MEPGPYHPILYWPHVVFGIGSIALALTAILAAKGTRLHRRTGQLFAVFMGIAAFSAIAFSFVRFAPPALFSAFSVLYGVGMAILSLRPRHGPWKAVQTALAAIPLLLTLVGLAAIVMLFAPQPEPIPFPVMVAAILLISATTVFFGWLFVGDIKFLRATDPDRIRRFKRHALRMAVGAAETARAPLISFGPGIGPDGAFSFPVYFFGCFLLVPIIYYGAMPAWVKKGDIVRAAKISTAAP